MKKIVVLSAIALVVLGFGFIRVFAETATTETTTETVTKAYNYINYQDLVDQIEADVYDEIYQEVYDDIYQDILDTIDQNTYDQMMADIETAINEQLTDLTLVNDETQNLIYDVVSLADQSVVGIENYMDDQGVSVGSGVIYDYNETSGLYYVITNHHVIEDGNNYYITFEDETSVSATLIKYDADMDIALLSFSGTGLDNIQVAPLGTSSVLEKGQIVIAVGHPQGFNFFNSVTFGVVAGLDRVVGGETITYIQHDAAINSGNSGGPIFNLAGEVVGINVLKYADTEIEGMGFSIPIDLVIDFINE